jgi:T-complex protein 1 subunit zeta
MIFPKVGQIISTKDGSVLKRQMQIQHPTASLIARTGSAQDATTGKRKENIEHSP